jgi:hypothetical protein
MRDVRRDVRRNHKHFLATATLALCATTISGCALFDPAVKPLGIKGTGVETLSSYQMLSDFNATCARLASTDDADRYGVCGSLAYVEGHRLAYLKASGLHSRVRNGTAMAVLPLSALALLYGITGQGSSESIARLGVGAGLAYSASSFATSMPKQQIYIDGAQAMTCLVANAVPLIVPASREHALSDSVRQLEDAITNLGTLLAETVDDDADRENDSAVIAARDELAADNDVRAKGEQTLASIRQAPLIVRTRADHIAQELDAQLIKQEPSLESLLAIAKNLGAVSQAFGQSGFPTPKAEEKNKSAGAGTGGTLQSMDLDQLGLSANKDSLREATATARARRATVESLLLELSNMASAYTNVAACKTASLASEFSVYPDSLERTVEKGKSIDFKVVNRSSLPTREVTGPNSDHIAVDDTKVAPDGKSFIVTLKGLDVTGADAPTLVIKDGTGNESRRIKITVTGTKTDSAPAETPKAPKASNTGMLTPYERDLAANPERVRDLQCGLAMPRHRVDCRIGPETRAFVRAFRATQEVAASTRGGDEITQRLEEAAVAKKDSNFLCEEVKCPSK